VRTVGRIAPSAPSNLQRFLLGCSGQLHHRLDCHGAPRLAMTRWMFAVPFPRLGGKLRRVLGTSIATVLRASLLT
jgi:hypothetical protein